MKQLIVILGPTGVGKTELSIQLAEYFSCPIVNADSRQLYKGLEIGTAAPTDEQKARVDHHLIGVLDVEEYYNASEYEDQALAVIEKLHKKHGVVIATGGSMMYIDALCKGIDRMPTIDQKLRDEVWQLYEDEGVEAIQSRLKILDPDFYDEVDLKNYKRVIHALEVCLMTGKPYSSYRKNTSYERPFNIIKIGLDRNREELYDRINQRVDIMLEQGLLKEAKLFYHLKHLNSLNTVGYKELYKFLDGEWTFDFAVGKIKQSTRNYARKQLSWFRRDKDIHWISLSNRDESEVFTELINIVENNINS